MKELSTAVETKSWDTGDLLLSSIKLIKFQGPGSNSYQKTCWHKKHEKQMDVYGQSKARCPSNFFKVGGINTVVFNVHLGLHTCMSEWYTSTSL